jgi:colanic acid/amylovoran biosynthesis glycosyltransferase
LTDARKQSRHFQVGCEGDLRLAYVVSRFPKVTETFILREVIELERSGCQIELYSLIRERQTEVTHPEETDLRAGTHFGWPPKFQLLSDQLFWLRRAPRRYGSAWLRALVGSARSPKSLLRAAAVVPVAATFARSMSELGIQRVHAHWATHPALAAFVIKHLTGIPYSLTVHAHDLYVDQTMLCEKLLDASFVVTVSTYNRDLLRSLCGPEVASRTKIIRSGVDPALFQPDESEPTAITGFRVICVAALEEYKGHIYLLDALNRLVSRGITLECTLVGEGPERSSLMDAVNQLGLSDRVSFVGAQSSDQVRKLLAGADIMVLPSVVLSNGLQEGLPVALIEAMAMGVPVVATRISGVPELVEDGETGLLVPERDSEALARAIACLHEAPEQRRKLGRAGRRKVLADYDLHTNVEQLRDLLVSSAL